MKEKFKGAACTTLYVLRYPLIILSAALSFYVKEHPVSGPLCNWSLGHIGIVIFTAKILIFAGTGAYVWFLTVKRG